MAAQPQQRQRRDKKQLILGRAQVSRTNEQVLQQWGQDEGAGALWQATRANQGFIGQNTYAEPNRVPANSRAKFFARGKFFSALENAREAVLAAAAAGQISAEQSAAISELVVQYEALFNDNDDEAYMAIQIPEMGLRELNPKAFFALKSPKTGQFLSLTSSLELDQLRLTAREVNGLPPAVLDAAERLGQGAKKVGQPLLAIAQGFLEPMGRDLTKMSAKSLRNFYQNVAGIPFPQSVGAGKVGAAMYALGGPGVRNAQIGGITDRIQYGLPARRAAPAAWTQVGRDGRCTYTQDTIKYGPRAPVKGSDGSVSCRVVPTSAMTQRDLTAYKAALEQYGMANPQDIQRSLALLHVGRVKGEIGDIISKTLAAILRKLKANQHAVVLPVDAQGNLAIVPLLRGLATIALNFLVPQATQQNQINQNGMAMELVVSGMNPRHSLVQPQFEAQVAGQLVEGYEGGTVPAWRIQGQTTVPEAAGAALLLDAQDVLPKQLKKAFNAGFAQQLQAQLRAFDQNAAQYFQGPQQAYQAAGAAVQPFQGPQGADAVQAAFQGIVQPLRGVAAGQA
eukprot:m.322538 g.322538  ORF g.322538 m.322538 type:complete len:566 (-) comp27100_c0_seq1:262-1959(-)